MEGNECAPEFALEEYDAVVFLRSKALKSQQLAGKEDQCLSRPLIRLHDPLLFAAHWHPWQRSLLWPSPKPELWTFKTFIIKAKCKLWKVFSHP
jgi:hypothetical protein